MIFHQTGRPSVGGTSYSQYSSGSAPNFGTIENPRMTAGGFGIYKIQY